MKDCKLYTLACNKIKEYLEKEKVNIENIKLYEIPIYFFEYNLRTIKKQNYKVFISKELKTNHLYNDYKDIIETIKTQAQNAENLNKYLSRGIKNITKPDDMLNDWGIMHMHLSDILEKDGFVKRTDDLLFLFKQNDKLYFLDIFEHENAWTRKRTLEILTNNWDILTDMNIDPSSLAIIPDENDIKSLREINVNSPVVLGDKAYISIGGGVTLSGVNINSVFNKNMLLKGLWKIEKSASENEIENVKIEIFEDKISIVLSNKMYSMTY